MVEMITGFKRKVKPKHRSVQGHSILRNYWVSRLFFKDPVRLQTESAGPGGENSIKNGQLNGSDSGAGRFSFKKFLDFALLFANPVRLGGKLKKHPSKNTEPTGPGAY